MDVIADPFPHVCCDGWADPGLCREAARSWPDADWPHWIGYESDQQAKRVCCDWLSIPEPCRRLLARMMLLPLTDWFGGPRVVPDALLWGGGMHAMGRGGRLGVHLDHSHHPLTGLERTYSAVLFLGEDWHDGWGGHLALYAPDCRTVARAYHAAFNRLVVFQTAENSYHGVLGPLSCPSGVVRKSLAVFFHASPQQAAARMRARFF